MENPKKLGIIGGMGPMATAYFMELIVEMTKAHKDEEHIEMDIVNVPSIPDRTAFILGESLNNPAEKIIQIRKELENREVQLIAIPCNTAFAFYDEISKGAKSKIANVIEITADYLNKRKIRKVGILATDGTVRIRLFQKEFAKRGIDCVYPDEAKQHMVMKLIYDDVKAGNPIPKEELDEISQTLFDQGAQVILLGCTELSMAKRDKNVGANYLDTLEVLAQYVVKECAQLKEEYQELITE